MTFSPSVVSLEDSWIDVLGKVMRGTGMTESRLLQATQLAPDQLKSILKGSRPTDDVLQRLAIALDLQPVPFVNLARQRYAPKPFDPNLWPDVLPIQSHYLDMTVNAYLVWDTVSRKAILFDTGTEVSHIEKYLRQYQLTLSTLAITHAHGDHIAVVSEIMSAYHPQLFAPKNEPVEGAHLLEDGNTFQVGGLKVRVLLTDGHSVGHLTYVIEGNPAWKAPVAIVGDAIFAGSMGGGGVSYSRLRNNVQNKILTLPPATLICPGHGPTTTVAEERENNPFA